MLIGEFREQYDALHDNGMAAKDAGEHETALDAFVQADTLAGEHDDSLKRMHALNPAARALWSMERFDEAAAKLDTAASIAAELGLSDEQGITVSNIGRIAAVKTIHTVPAAHQARALKDEAVPKFREAFDTLRNHPHLYYRYANAQHGSVVSALAGERRMAGRLIAEGFRVAFRRSPEPYDQVRTYEISRKGLAQLLAATALVPFGNRTPVAAGIARRKLVG